MDEPASVGEELLNKYGNQRGTFINFNVICNEPDTTDDKIFVNHIDEDNKLIECLINLSELGFMPNPINMQNIHNHQQQDANLLTQNHH